MAMVGVVVLSLLILIGILGLAIGLSAAKSCEKLIEKEETDEQKY